MLIAPGLLLLFSLLIVLLKGQQHNRALLLRLLPSTGVVGLLFSMLLLSVSGGSSAQSMSVIGGNEKARECYDNAGVAGKLESVNPGLLEPCNFALNHVTLTLGDRAATFTNRGVILYSIEKFDQSLADFETALAMSPNNGEIYVNRGNLYFLTREYDAALQDYNKALELEIRQMQLAHLNRAMLYERRGDKGLAEADYRLALEYAPGWDLAQQKLTRLLEEVSKQNEKIERMPDI